MALYSRYRWSEARTIPLGDEADYCLRVRTRVAGRKWTLFVVHTASPSSAQRRGITQSSAELLSRSCEVENRIP